MNTDLFSPSHLKSLCEVYDLVPSKKYGQNYLISPKPIEAMVEAGELSPRDTIVEIGPGFGVLTFALAPKVQNVVAFEIEKKLQPYWEGQAPDNVEVVWGNALKQFPERSALLPTGYKVLANLPYQITSHALRLLLEAENKPERIIVMVQKEVADRIVAQPGKMSLLSVSVQYYGTPRIVTKVPRGSFWPAPKVNSAVVEVKGIRAKDKKEEEAFFSVVKAAFSSKRKQAWKNIATGLGLDGDRVKQVLKEVAGNEKIRAEAVSIEEWERIIAAIGNTDS